MEVLKRRLALYLAVLLFVPVIAGAFPGVSEEVQAAKSYTLSWSGGKTSGTAKTTIKVEAGQKFYIGDLIAASASDERTCGSLLKMTYSSSKSSVAAVGKNTGLVTAKKSGTATISAKYGKKTMKCTLKVVKKGSLKTTSTYKSLNSAANTFVKSFPTEITAKKAVKAIKALKTFENAWDKKNGWSSADEYGFRRDKNYNTTNELIVPMAGRAEAMRRMFSTYAGNYIPTSTESAHCFKISKAAASVSKNAITVTLKEKAAEREIISLQYFNKDYAKLNNTVVNKAQFRVSITDLTTKKVYWAIGEASTGSKTITLKLYDVTYKNGTESWKRASFVKGHKYQLGSKYNWTKGKTVTAK